MFNTAGAFAEFGRDLTRDRTSAGLAAARATGRVGGRPNVMTQAKLTAARAVLADDETHAAAAVGVSTIAQIREDEERVRYRRRWNLLVIRRAACFRAKTTIPSRTPAIAKARMTGTTWVINRPKDQSGVGVIRSSVELLTYIYQPPSEGLGPHLGAGAADGLPTSMTAHDRTPRITD